MYRAAAAALKAADQHQQETSDAILATENRMAKMPARTVAGALSKLRAVGVEITDEIKGRDGVLDETSLGSMERLTLSALADLERLGGEAAPIGATSVIEDPVLALKGEWEARYKVLNEQPDDDSDEALQPFYDRVHETEVQILRTPATSLAGIMVKLVLWARQHLEADATTGLSWNHEPIEGQPLDLDHLPVVSALHDLERMAQEFVAAGGSEA